MSIPDIFKEYAKKRSHEADTTRITGNMYGLAAAILAESWVYGEELRKWHNLATQVHDEGEIANREGGILNPAVLCISPRSV